MRIGIDARMYSGAFTGIGRYVLELLSHLLSIDTENEYTIFMNEPGFHEFYPKRGGVRKTLVNAPIYSFAEQTEFLKKLWDAKLNLMHFTHFNAPIFYRRPSVVTIHDLTISFFPGKKRAGIFDRFGYRLVLKSIIRRAKKIIAVSEHTKKDIIKLFQTEADKIAVIHEGVNPQFHPIADAKLIDDFREKIGINKPFLLYTGNWRNHKNLVNLIKAFGILKNKYKIPHLLVITGREDPWYPEVKETVRSEKLEGFVRFTGIVPDDDLVLLYNTADVYVFPSLYEGFGLPALEAFACETPVCASNASSLPEVCGDAAVYFDPYNPQDMAHVIAKVCADEARRKDLIEKGLQRMRLFSWQKMAEGTLRVYKDCASCHPEP